ncbi:hypothetical protein [Nonomuraea candida]|uniref:hypothetical protein n=1 Tax=Nonomuraea candida TaxID=359159 RepID=UPI0005B90826|nr:hypothetical protein [Nonomuraea candida]
MSPVTPEMINYYTQLLKDLERVKDGSTNALFWMVVRGREEPLTVADVARRLGADPNTAVLRTVLEPAEHAVLEQSDHGVIVLAADVYIDGPDIWARLTENAQAWGFWYLINAANRLFYAADGQLVTEVDILYPEPSGCWGPDPRALDSYLGALRALADQKRTDDQAGVTPPAPYPEWETALATVEAMTGVRLDVDRFARGQQWVRPLGGRLDVISTE